jgi:hypothetical protein
MADVARYAVGVELFDVAIAQALGRPVPDEMVAARWVRPLAIRFLTASPGVLPVGTVTAIAGLDAVRAAPGVLAAGVYFGVGDRIGPLRVDADRSGYIVATADTASAALERADAAMEKLVVRAHTDEPISTEAGSASVVPLSWLSPVAIVIGVLILTLFGGRLAGRTTLPDRSVSGIALGRPLSPACGCSRDVVDLTFKLLRNARVSVRMLDDAGQPIATLLRPTPLNAGWEHLAWNGRTGRRTLAPDGDYRAEIELGTPPRAIVTTPVEVEAPTSARSRLPAPA